MFCSLFHEIVSESYLCQLSNAKELSAKQHFSGLISLHGMNLQENSQSRNRYKRTHMECVLVGLNNAKVPDSWVVKV